MISEQDGRQFGILKGVDISALVGFPQVAHATSGRCRRVDLQHRSKHRVAKDALMKILEAYVNKALLPWTERFPSSFFKQIYRLHGWQFREGRTRGPRIVGKLINRLVYEQLPPGVLQELRQRNPVVYATSG